MTEARDIARQDRGPVIDDLLASCAALRAENAGLREDFVRSSEDMGRICAENAELREVLNDVMDWIANWDQNFIHDEEWGATEDRARAALTR